MNCGPKVGWCRRVPGCNNCTLAATSEPFWRNWGLPGPLVPLAPLVALPVCSHEGAIVERCVSCGDQPGRHVRDCSHPANPTETCTRDHPRAAVWNCQTCPQHTGRRRRPPPSILPPLSHATIDTTGFARAPDRGPFNGGEFVFRGRRLFAYRVGLFGSRVHVAELTAAGAVVRDVRLDLSHPRAAAGQDDPVLSTFRGRLRVWFVGCEDNHRKGSQLYADLSDDLRVERVYYPDYAARQRPFEKNWMPFEHAGEQYAVYTIRPHVVIRIDGDRATKVHETPYPFPWAGGHLRGGAPPVLHDGRFYHWFHGKVEPRTPLLYSVGVYTFAAEPPFAPIAGSPAPLLWGDDAEARRVGCEFAVVFPRGAILHDGVWEVTGGEYDTRLARWRWDAAAVDRLLAGSPGRAAGG